MDRSAVADLQNLACDCNDLQAIRRVTHARVDWPANKN
jgi:hypothetical protein